jgi:predicted nucleotidyltransferase
MPHVVHGITMQKNIFKTTRFSSGTGIKKMRNYKKDETHWLLANTSMQQLAGKSRSGWVTWNGHSSALSSQLTSKA